MDEQEKAFVIASIKLKAEHDKKEKKKAEARAKKKHEERTVKQGSSIQTGIELNDQFSGVLNNIISSVNLAVSAMYDMQQSMNADIDTSSLEGARDEINQATAAIEAMNQAASRQTAPDIAPPVVDGGNQEPISVPVDPVLPDPLVENPEDRKSVV